MGRKSPTFWVLLTLAAAVIITIATAGAIAYKHRRDAAAFRAATRAACASSQVRQNQQRHLNSSGQPQLVVIGDSYSEGQGVPSVTDAWDRLITGYHTIVLAQGGAAYTHDGPCGTGIFSAQLRTALAAHPTVVVMQGGLNDVGSAPAKIASAVNAVLSQLPPRTVVVGPADAPALSLRAERQIDAILRTAAAKDGMRYVTLLDLPQGDFGADRVHPNIAGERFIAAKVQPALA